MQLRRGTAACLSSAWPASRSGRRTPVMPAPRLSSHVPQARPRPHSRPVLPPCSASSSDEDGSLTAYRRVVPADAERYWQNVVANLPSGMGGDEAASARARIDPGKPLGFTIRSRNQVTSMCTVLKSHFPTSLIVVQTGSAGSYDALGIDAVVLAYELGYRLTVPSKGVVKCTVQQGEVAGAVQKLNQLNYFVVVAPPASTPLSGNDDLESLLTISTPARPAYFSALEAKGSADEVNAAFVAQKPIIGVAWSVGTGFITLTLDLGLNKVLVRRALTRDAVLSTVAYTGAAAVLLHRSLDAQQALRQALAGLGRQRAGVISRWNGALEALVDTFLDQVWTTGLATGIKTADRGEGRFTVEVVCGAQEGDARPQPLPRSTVMQLGLEGNGTVRSLQAVVLPAGSALCQQWMRSLLLMPPPPAMALHIHAVVRHLATFDQAIVALVSSMPAGKVTEVLSTRKGTPAFFRELHGMLSRMLAAVTAPQHAAMWANLLPYAMWTQLRSGEQLDAPAFAAHLAQAQAAVEAFVDLEGPPPSDKGSASPTRRSKSADEPNVFAELRAAHETFYHKVAAAKLQPELQQVERTLQRFKSELEQFQALLKRHDNVYSAAIVAEPSLRRDASSNITECHIVLRVVPRTFACGREAAQVCPDAVQVGLGRVDKDAATLWITRAAALAHAAYVDACFAAELRVAALLEELCVELQPLAKHLALACQCSVVGTALRHHVEMGRKEGWALPELALPGGDEGSRSADATDDAPDAPARRVFDAAGYWPFWMPRSPPTVRNDLVLDRLVLLTGPNMAGKSTVLRSVCAVALLANCGLMVPARSARVPFYDAFLLRNFSGDAPVEGMSSFALEMQEVKIADELCTPRSLVLFDEMCKGTEVGKGSALAGALLIDWCRRGFTGIFASHLHPLVSMARSSCLEERGRLAFMCMGLTAGDGSGGVRRGTWQLHGGVCFESLAFDVARDQGLPDRLLASAEVLYAELQQGRHALVGRPEHKAEPAAADASSPEPAGRVRERSPSPSPSPRPGKSLEEAAEVMARVVRGAAPAAEVVWVRRREVPPPLHAKRAALYVARWSSGLFYVGQTTSVENRIVDHRRQPFSGSRNGSEPHRGPDTEFIYVTLTREQAGAMRGLEYALIRSLTEEGFSLTNSQRGPSY